VAADWEMQKEQPRDVENLEFMHAMNEISFTLPFGNNDSVSMSDLEARLSRVSETLERILSV
jgi:hypothetical protein